jgi:hypothetical protein
VRTLIIAGAFLVAAVPMAPRQETNINPSLFADMKWRNVGPHRASRTRAAAGHPSQ